MGKCSFAVLDSIERLQPCISVMACISVRHFIAGLTVRKCLAAPNPANAERQNDMLISNCYVAKTFKFVADLWRLVVMSKRRSIRNNVALNLRNGLITMGFIKPAAS